MGPAPSRKDLIESIQRRRRSKVLTYFVADRQPIPAQIGEDAVRPMYEHLLSLGRSREIDLFVYARGGMIEVPLENSYNDPGVYRQILGSCPLQGF
jgi:hypothetical protein